MKLSELKAEQLDAVLNSLTGDAARDLLQAIEMTDSGAAGPDGVIAQRLRDLVRGKNAQPIRQDAALRHFIDPFEDFLTPRALENKQKGRIARASIKQIWTWLNRDLLPDKLSQLVEQCETADAANDRAKVKQLIDVMHRDIHAAVTEALSDLKPGSQGYIRLAGHVGGPAVLEDAREMVQALKFKDVIEKIRNDLPEVIGNCRDDDIERYTQIYREFEEQTGGFGWIFLLILMRRLTSPSEIIWLVSKITGSITDTDIRAHNAGVAIECALHDMEISADNAIQAIRNQDNIVSVLDHIAKFHMIADELAGELEIDMKGNWGKTLVRVRTKLGDAIRYQISDTPRRVKLVLFCGFGTDDKGSTLTSGPEQEDLDAAEFAIRLLLGVRSYLRQLPINAEYAGLSDQVKQFVERIGDATVNRLRTAHPDERPFVEEYFQANILFTSIMFGQEAANLLRRQGRVASKSEAMPKSA